jgi:anthranilate phosphoribosyltransferase
MNTKALFQKLQESFSLNREESQLLSREIVSGSVDPVVTGALLALMSRRPYTVSEVLGFRDTLLETCKQINLSDWSPIDVCGTGGDGKSTFNISTASALVLAGAKVPVAKHGNHGVSSLFGSSTIMEAMGYVFSSDEEKLRRELDTCSICFLHAPLFHPAMKEVAPVRKALGIRTIFNLLGPLLNPALVKMQMSGVYAMEIFSLYTEVLQEVSERCVVVHSSDGYDEVSLTAPCHVFRDGVSTFLEPGVSPYAGAMFPYVSAESLRAPETLEKGVEAMYTFLRGEADPDLEKVVVTNAALAYTMRYPQVTLESAMLLLHDVVRSGAAYDNTKKLLGMQG